ncbi:MAG: hypothetical protein KF873_02545 [Gemmataceae bacterium]|nr:hypothetical protein [Gemmataceae bacterium]
MDTAAIIREILTDYALHPRGFHGVVHWARVLENGLKLAEATGANQDVVTLFALFHDSRRVNDGHDWGHGLRGAQLAKRLRGNAFDLDDASFELLFRACEWHTEGESDSDLTVCTCWDADRLDLGRVGIRPDPKYLCTKAARSPAIIEWADKRARREFEPTFVIEGWGIPLDFPGE